MKTKIMIALLGSMVHMVCTGQTPEEIAGQKMLDSIMRNMPEDQRAMMQQMMQMGKEADKKRKAERDQQLKAKEKQRKIDAKKGEMEFYWRNKIASNTNGRFENWPHGSVVIKASFFNGNGVPPTYLKLGEISADGQVTLKLPKLDFKKWQRVNITKGAGDQFGHSFNDQSLDLSFSNKNVTYFTTDHRVNVFKGDKNLGFLTLGNAIKPVVNLNAPCCFDKAGDGYTAYWVFMSQGNTISGNNGTIVHDLKFQPGWNLIKVRVAGAKEKPSRGIPGPNYWKNQYYTATTTLPADAKYYFTSNQ